MKAILIYPLYRRPKPTNEVEAVGYLAKGAMVDVLKIDAGAALEGISIWMFANDGYWYWGGGLEMNISNKFMEWQQLSKDQKISVVTSIVNDKSNWIEKKVVDYRGCAVGYKNDDLSADIGLSIFVGKKADVTTLGKTFFWKGIEVPVDYKGTGDIEEQLKFVDNFADKSFPQRVGGSIREQNSSSIGTRSMVLFKDEGGKRIHYLAACFHVLLNAHKGINVRFKTTNVVLSNKRVRYPAISKPNLKELSDLPIEEAIYNEKNDFCLVRLPDNFDILNRIEGNPIINFSDFHRFQELQALSGQRVTMSGATSGKQSADVNNTIGRIKFDSSPVEFVNILITGPMSSPGDSGAPVVDNMNKLVGIVIGGDEENRTYILPVFGFLIDFNLQLIK